MSAAALLAVVPGLVDLIRKWIPDRAAQDVAIAEINQVVAAAAAKVGDAMLEDAKSQRFFNSGWRPYLGWMGGAGLTVHFLVFPLASMFVPSLVSPLDVGSLMPLVLTLLGLGGLRTVEKIKR